MYYSARVSCIIEWQSRVIGLVYSIGRAIDHSAVPFHLAWPSLTAAVQLSERRATFDKGISVVEVLKASTAEELIKKDMQKFALSPTAVRVTGQS